MYVYTYIYIYTYNMLYYLCVYVYVCIYIYVYIHTHLGVRGAQEHDVLVLQVLVDEPLHVAVRDGLEDLIIIIMMIIVIIMIYLYMYIYIYIYIYIHTCCMTVADHISLMSQPEARCSLITLKSVPPSACSMTR